MQNDKCDKEGKSTRKWSISLTWAFWCDMQDCYAAMQSKKVGHAALIVSMIYDTILRPFLPSF